MGRSLSVAVSQPPCVPQGVVANAISHAAVIRSAGARVVVFPELSLTGYELDAETLTAEDWRLTPIVQACAEAGTLALVGAPVCGQAGRSHIAIVAVQGSGASIVYRKLYLGGSEANRFAPGSGPAVVEVDGWRIGLAICKDMGTPQHAADTARLCIDVYVAATLESAKDRDLQDHRACRVACDHNVWVATASFAGSTGAGYADAAGHSSIRAPGGAIVAQAGSETGAIARATLR